MRSHFNILGAKNQHFLCKWQSLLTFQLHHPEAYNFAHLHEGASTGISLCRSDAGSEYPQNSQTDMSTTIQKDG